MLKLWWNYCLCNNVLLMLSYLNNLFDWTYDLNFHLDTGHRVNNNCTGQRTDILPVASTPSAFPSNTSASAETAGCSQCPLDWQQFPDWSLRTKKNIQQTMCFVHSYGRFCSRQSFYVLMNSYYQQVSSLLGLSLSLTFNRDLLALEIVHISE